MEFQAWISKISMNKENFSVLYFHVPAWIGHIFVNTTFQNRWKQTRLKSLSAFKTMRKLTWQSKPTLNDHLQLPFIVTNSTNNRWLSVTISSDNLQWHDKVWLMINLTIPLFPTWRYLMTIPNEKFDNPYFFWMTIPNEKFNNFCYPKWQMW